MKKLLSALLCTSILFAGTGCLKDKGFEDQKYGIQINEVRAVTFPQSSASPVLSGITGQAAPLTVAGPFITIEGDAAAASDVHVKLAFSDALVTAKSLTPLPTGSYSLSTTDVVIKAGQRFDSTLKLIINNSNVLDPTKTYGVGITITSVDGGYAVAANSKNVVLGFTIKNKYDGIYSIKGYHVRGGDAALTGPTGDFERSFSTSGPVSIQWMGTVPWGYMASSLPAGYEPIIAINETTNKVTITSSNGLVSQNASYDNRYDPATKTFFIKWGYAAAAERSFTDTLKYSRPR